MSDQPSDMYQHGQLYDLVMDPEAEPEAVAFYRRQIERYGQPVLELASGTGSFTVPLAAAGIDIIGLDLAPAMLDIAAGKAAARGLQVPLIEGDMRSFDLGRTFGLIFVPTQSFSHLYQREDIEACLAAVRRHLAPDGRFIIELFNPSLTILSRDPEQRYPVGRGSYLSPSGSGQIRVSEQASYDAAAQLYSITWFYLFEDTGHEEVVSYQMRQFYPQEIDALLWYNGFEIEHKYGSVDETPFASSSLKQIIICRAR